MNRDDHRSGIPQKIADYLGRAVPEPPDSASGTLLSQEGTMRLGPDKPWRPFTAEQTFDARRVGFVWHARVKMAPLVTCVVDDAFEDGHGRLDAKVLGVVPVAHARGVEVDRGEAQRYLSELVWCPLAFVHNPELRFLELPGGEVRVWVGDEATYVDLSFGEDGDVESVRTTTRVRGDLGAAQDWEGRFFGYADFDGIRAPSGAEVEWQTPEGPYLYWRGRVTSLEWR